MQRSQPLSSHTGGGAPHLATVVPGSWGWGENFHPSATGETPSGSVRKKHHTESQSPDSIKKHLESFSCKGSWRQILNWKTGKPRAGRHKQGGGPDNTGLPSGPPSGSNSWGLVTLLMCHNSTLYSGKAMLSFHPEVYAGIIHSFRQLIFGNYHMPEIQR